MEQLILFVKNIAGNDIEKQFVMAKALNQGMLQRGSRYNTLLQDWNIEIANNILENIPVDTADWNLEINAQQQYAAEIAGTFKVVTLEPALKKLLASRIAGEDSRAAAASALLVIAPESNLQLIYEGITNEEESVPMRQKFARSMGQTENKQTRDLLAESLKNSHYEVQIIIALMLVNNSKGINLLMKSIKEGYAPARLLKERAIEESLLSKIEPQYREEYLELTANILPISEEREKLIKERLAVFDPNGKTVAMGKMIFSQNCIMCHQIDNVGGMIGPQLDGIGNWGRIALTTKILDPNRNITENFRTYNFILKDGKTVSGLFRREEGQLIILANPLGEEFSISKQDIVEKVASQYTLMPDNFHSTISKVDFDALLVYLLNVK